MASSTVFGICSLHTVSRGPLHDSDKDIESVGREYIITVDNGEQRGGDEAGKMPARCSQSAVLLVAYDADMRLTMRETLQGIAQDRY